MPPLPTAFLHKKNKILAGLSVPISEYDDLSPKGSIDFGIRELIDEINANEGWVTTSSCAGRVSVFMEGVRAEGILETSFEAKSEVEGNSEIKGNGEEREYEEGGEVDGEPGGKMTTAKVGGKGGGGRWLFVSHDPVVLEGTSTSSLAEKLGMSRVLSLSGVSRGPGRRFVHFKFEPMVYICSYLHKFKLISCTRFYTS